MVARRSGIQVPRLERVGVVEPSTEGRLTAQAPDTSAPTRAIAQGLDDIADAAIKYLEKSENDYGNNIAVGVGTEYDQWVTEKLEGKNGIKFIDGDPTEAYNKFQEEEATFRESLLARDYDDKVRGKVQKKLLERSNLAINRATVFEGNQYSVFRDRTYNSAVNIEKTKNAMDSVALLDPNDVSTTAPFDDVLSRITSSRVEQGVAVGTVQESAEGNYRTLQDGKEVTYQLSKPVMESIAKDTSEATYNAINNLLASDKLDHAKFMMSRYDNYLDPVNKAKLTEKIEKETVKEKAINLVASAFGKSPDEQRKIITGEKDPEIKQEAMKRLAAQERYQSQIESRDSSEIYNKLFIRIQDRMKSSEPFETIYQLDDDPEFSRLIGRVTNGKQRQALYELVEAPKESNEEQLADMLDALRNGKFVDMSAGQLAQQSAGLSESHKNLLRREWIKVNTESESQEAAKVSRVTKEVYRQFQANGLIKVVKGKETKRSKQERAAFETDLLGDVQTLPPNMSYQEVSDYVRDRVADFIYEKKKDDYGFIDEYILGKPAPTRENVLRQSKKYEPPERSRYKGKGRVQAPAVKNTGGSKPFEQLSQKEQFDLMDQYEKTTGQKADNIQKLEEWRKKQGK